MSYYTIGLGLRPDRKGELFGMSLPTNPFTSTKGYIFKMIIKKVSGVNPQEGIIPGINPFKIIIINNVYYFL